MAALTGLPADSTITRRPIVAVKIDNYGAARPQWGLEQADAVIEENVEGITRFVALFHTNLPVAVGPVRSARTGDLDLLTAMNRPVFGFSGANSGVTQWIDSAEGSGVLVDFSAQHAPCYSRSPERPGPHNLLLDSTCAASTAVTAGPAPPAVDDRSVVDATERRHHRGRHHLHRADGRRPHRVDVGSARVARTSDPRTVSRTSAVSGARIAAATVVEIATTHIPSPVDARSPNPITVGTGIAVVHRDGVAISATWSRATPYDPFRFTAAATNQPIPLDTGTTFIELERG